MPPPRDSPGCRTAGAAVGHDDDVADVARVPEPPVEQPPVEHDAAADAGRHHHGRCNRADPTAAPTQPSPEREGLGVVVDERRRARSTRPGGPAGGTTRQPAMFSGDTSSPPGLIGPPHPLPQTTRRSPAPDPADNPLHQARPGRSRGPRRRRDPDDARVGRIARSTREPSRPTRPAAILVPPMSTASARSATEGSLPRPGSAPRHAGTGSAGPTTPRAMVSSRAGGSGSGTSRGRRSRHPRSRWPRRPPSAPRPSIASGRAIPPDPCGAGCARTTPRRRT